MEANEANITQDDSNVSFTKSVSGLFSSKEEAEGKVAEPVPSSWESISDLFEGTEEEKK